MNWGYLGFGIVSIFPWTCERRLKMFFGRPYLKSPPLLR